MVTIKYIAIASYKVQPCMQMLLITLYVAIGIIVLWHACITSCNAMWFYHMCIYIYIYILHACMHMYIASWKRFSAKQLAISSYYDDEDFAVKTKYSYYS